MERTTIPVEERLRHNEQIEAERKSWHECKRNESDEWRERQERCRRNGFYGWHKR